MQDYWPTLVSVASSIMAAYLSARWAVHGALKERWWEQKCRAYSEIIEALHHLIWHSEILNERYELMEDAPKIPKAAERRERYLDAQLTIRKATDIGAFIISDEAARILDNLQDRTTKVDSEVPAEVVANENCRHYQIALKDIRECARRDLKGGCVWFARLRGVNRIFDFLGISRLNWRRHART